MNTLRNIDTWEIEVESLTDSSMVYNVVGNSGNAIVTFNCFNERDAIELQQMLMIQGGTVEARA